MNTETKEQQERQAGAQTAGGANGAVTPLSGNDGLIICPACKAKQQKNRHFCYKCEAKFAL